MKVKEEKIQDFEDFIKEGAEIDKDGNVISATAPVEKKVKFQKDIDDDHEGTW